MNQAFAARGWRGFCQNFLRSRQQAVIEPVDEASFAASAIVFAPHQDDETLGCGGTIICKRLAGVKIKIVYLTDGSGANAHLGVVAPDELRQIREAEAIVAAQTLGVAAENVVFLNFQDGQLQRWSRFCGRSSPKRCLCPIDGSLSLFLIMGQLSKL
jgi:GlcNAc-PI de-N-acetylase